MTERRIETGKIELRDVVPEDFDHILHIINCAAEAYRGVIPPDRWHEHYMPAEALASEMADRSEEHTSELQSLMRNSYAVFCLKKKTTKTAQYNTKVKQRHST